MIARHYSVIFTIKKKQLEECIVKFKKKRLLGIIQLIFLLFLKY